jgi:tagatose 1,6-diphosphate aldolase
VASFAISGEQAGRAWLQDTGKRNIEELNVVLKETASSWFEKVK